MKYITKKNLNYNIKSNTKKKYKVNNSNKIMNIKVDLILLPNQLFPIDRIYESLISKIKLQNDNNNNEHININISLCFLEHPIFYGDRKRVKNMKFNKRKLIYHRSTSKLYFDTISKLVNNTKKFSNKINITLLDTKYINYTTLKKYKNPLQNIIATTIKNNADANNNKFVLLFDPIDHELYDELKKFSKNTNNKILMLDTLLFTNTSKQLELFHNQKNKKESFYHSTFYSWQKTQLDILKNTKSYDMQNRNTMPKELDIPSLPSIDNNKPINKKYIQEAIKYINKIKPYNYGSINKPEDLQFPITRKSTLKWLGHFCIHRLSNFGKFQDSIDSHLGPNKEPHPYLFHSCISPMLNIGLITPFDVIEYVTNYYNKNKSKIELANYEGFIRQVIGWREYQRYCYLYSYDKMISSNYFNNNKKLNDKWYNGTLGIKPVDDAIKMGFKYGYLHHILRLMVVGNFMNLSGIHPDEAYKWFMEFSIDSYDWVMIQNVYSMALWCDGGLTMRKPYISGDGYIMKMSNYNKEKDILLKDGTIEKYGWNKIWYSLYYNFINNNKDKLKNTYYAGMIKNWNKKTETEKKKIKSISFKVISRITK